MLILISTEDADFPPLGASSHQRNISLEESRRPTPPYPPGLPVDAPSESRRSTPTLPPGIRRPSAVPDLEGSSISRPSSRASLKSTTSSQIGPALPLRPLTPAKPAAPTNQPQRGKDEGKDEELERPTKAPKGGIAQIEAQKTADGAVAIPELKQKAPTPQPTVSETLVEKKVEDDAKIGAEPTETTTQEPEEQVKRPAVSPKPSRESAPRAFQPASKSQATVQTSDAQAVPANPSKEQPAQTSTKKRTPPGKLDIAAAVSKAPVVSEPAASADIPTPSVAQRTISQAEFESAKPESPSGSLASPGVKSAPKTLRVVPPPKTETPPAASSSTPREPGPSSAKHPSRQPSVASIQFPGTPSSEQVSMSDYVSMPSTSQSRANSPPPAESSKATTQPRAKTKIQLKKERQERAKAIEEDKKPEEPKQLASEEPAQEAIVTRKKKTKKDKEPKSKAKAPAPPPTGDSTPTASRAPSPPPIPTEETPTKAEPAAEKAKSSEPETPTKAPAANPSPIPSPHEPSPPPTPTLTAAQLLAELKATTPEIQKCLDSLFRPPSSNHYKPTQSILPSDVGSTSKFKTRHENFKLNLTKDQVDALLKGTAPFVRYPFGEEGRVWDRGMITPGGAHLRALTEELETRFLELEKLIRELPEELRFRPTKPQNDVKFPSVDLEALKRRFDNGGARGANVMEQMVQDGSTMKKGAFLVDDASKYLNEFIMPPATPPPSAGSGSVRGQASAAAQGSSYDLVGAVPSVDIAERQLNEARRIVDERDTALKKIIKKNKKLLGLS